MSTHRYQIITGGDTPQPRDYVTNTIYLRHAVDFTTGGQDLIDVANDLLDAWKTKWMSGGGTREQRCKVYNVGPPPQYPLEEVSKNLGQFPAAAGPREVAVCLSFKSDGSPPARHRGRVFLPMAFRDAIPANARVPQAHRDAAITLAQAIADVGGPDVDWVTHSETTGLVAPVSFAWCDDEWDTIRSRGMRSTTRSSVTLSE